LILFCFLACFLEEVLKISINRDSALSSIAVNITMHAQMPDLSSLSLGISTNQKTVFVRIGVQINNVNNMLFSPVEEITIN